MKHIVSALVLLSCFNLSAGYSTQYTGKIFKENERASCASHLEGLVQRAEELGLRVAESMCQPVGSSWRPTFNYFHKFNDRIEKKSFRLESEERCALEKARVRSEFSSKEVSYFESYCEGSRFTLELVSKGKLVRDLDIYSAFKNYEACQAYAQKVSSSMNGVASLESVAYLCEKERTSSTSFSPVFMYVGRKSLQTLRGDLLTDEPCVLSTGDVEGDFLKAGLEVISRECLSGHVENSSFETIVYTKPYTKNVDSYKGLKYSSKGECLDSLEGIAEFLRSEKKEPVYSFCSSVYKEKFVPTVYFVK